MRRRAFTTVIILFTVLAYHPGLAQEWPFELWHEGKIVLEERDTLVGLVKYDQQQDLVQFSDHQLANEIYSARKVLFFEIFDASANRYRKFFTLPYSGAGQYKAPVFFELLTEGKLTLLSREYIELRTISSPYSIHGYTREVLAYRFFFLNEDGEIVEFVGKKNDLLELMGDKSKDVNKFIRVNRLRVEEKYDMLRIIDYYNSLFRV
ncbi:MAG TPA: hypothetical protein VD927_02645 [Chryseosolibacter sp.]|nr:hypothetical protein [Chryseosolibacter sp.]